MIFISTLKYGGQLDYDVIQHILFRGYSTPVVLVELLHINTAIFSTCFVTLQWPGIMQCM